MNVTNLAQMLFAEQTFIINILDVGAIGLEEECPPYDTLVKAGYARIVGFEPNVAGCEELNQKYGDPHLFLPHFLGNGEKATFYETNWAPTGSLYKPNKPLQEKFRNLHELCTLVAEHQVETSRLDDLPEVGDIDFVKIDVQGAELSVFQSGERVMRNAVLVQTEVEFVELYENQPLFADIDPLLRSYGYQFHTFLGAGGRCFKPMLISNDANKPLRQMLWSDAIYVKNWLQFDALTLNKLKKLALLLHEVVASYDLCHVVLSEIDSRSATDYAAQYLASVMSSPQRR